ncbi:hypothetical protein C8F04DRAFT_1172239 [Mycena alexandri]|uniref:Uncharacterized protein n=1 Tax=Mycena alexandri TaxID=1745969 RepID=A0AAD6XJZ1_9AGAR|nr:hypothetical protein C8F04DRAFT_1172239 [Mycena alexandri]
MSPLFQPAWAPPTDEIPAAEIAENAQAAADPVPVLQTSQRPRHSTTYFGRWVHYYCYPQTAASTFAPLVRAVDSESMSNGREHALDSRRLGRWVFFERRLGEARNQRGRRTWMKCAAWSLRGPGVRECGDCPSWSLLPAEMKKQLGRGDEHLKYKAGREFVAVPARRKTPPRNPAWAANLYEDWAAIRREVPSAFAIQPTVACRTRIRIMDVCARSWGEVHLRGDPDVVQMCYTGRRSGGRSMYLSAWQGERCLLNEVDKKRRASSGGKTGFAWGCCVVQSQPPLPQRAGSGSSARRPPKRNCCLFELVGGVIADFNDTCVSKFQRKAAFTVAALHLGHVDRRPATLLRGEVQPRTISGVDARFVFFAVKQRDDPGSVFRNSMWPLDEDVRVVDAPAREPPTPSHPKPRP